jgi:hypothetical protein
LFPSFDFDTAITSTTATITSTDTATLGRVMILNYSNTDKTATVQIQDGKPVEATTVEQGVQQYAQMLLRTELKKYNVYSDTEFGVSYLSYLGLKTLPAGYITSELKRELTEKITALSVVSSVSDFLASLSGTTLTVSFAVTLMDGATITISEEVSS